MSKYAALIPIKDHSERVPGKNFRPFGGRPLWEHIVATLSGIEAIDTIYIDTDSSRFTPRALAAFPKVRIVERPEILRGDFVETNALFEYDLTKIPAEYDRFLQTHTTNPLLTAEHIERAMMLFEGAVAAGTHDSLFSVSAHYSRFYRRDLTPINHNPAELKRTQDLEPMLEENSNIYLFTRASFAAGRRRIGGRPLLYEMSPLDAVDIDDAQTWRLAKTLLAMSD